MTRITLCSCLCSSSPSSSSSSRDSASVIRNIEKFGAKNYFTDHRTTNTMYPLRDSFPILKIHDCYWDTKKFEQPSNFWPSFFSISDNPRSKNDWSDVTWPWGILDFTDRRGGRSLEACQEIIKKLSYLILHIITCSIAQFLCSFLYFSFFFKSLLFIPLASWLIKLHI